MAQAITLLVTNPGKTEFVKITVDPDNLTLANPMARWARLKIHLEASFRAARKPLSKGLVMEVLRAKVTEDRPEAMLVVHKHLVIIEFTRDSICIPFKANKPGINDILDFRQKPAPFNRDGSCTG